MIKIDYDIFDFVGHGDHWVFYLVLGWITFTNTVVVEVVDTDRTTDVIITTTKAASITIGRLVYALLDWEAGACLSLA